MKKKQTKAELVTDFLTRIMSDENEDTKDRLKASELLTKAGTVQQEGERIEIKVVYQEEE